jgi:hypothetical protein
VEENVAVTVRVVQAMKQFTPASAVTEDLQRIMEFSDASD